MSITSLDTAYVAGTYKRFPVEIASGKGSVLTDTSGKEYIDMGTGIGVTAFGIADEEWQKAVIEQIGKVQHTSNLYYTEPCALLAEQLCLRTGMKKVFFSNSGEEANECAIKIARKYAEEKKGAEHSTIVTLKNSFHGRTLTTLAATGQDKFHEHFRPLTPGFIHFEAGNIYELEAILAKHKVAAVLIECIQGEGGIIPMEAEFLHEMSDYLKKHDVLLMIDEVQSGNGRTGALYSYMNYGIEPDVVTTAKGLGGGLPIGATLFGEKVQNVLGYGDHGSTFGGNPVSCAGALSILGRMDDAFLSEVRRKGELVKTELSGAKGIENVCGMGLMIGVKTVRPASEVINECMGEGVLFISAKEKVRLLPALNIPDDILKKALDVLKNVCARGVN